jgi:polysaccharide export outer membrane protein
MKIKATLKAFALAGLLAMAANTTAFAQEDAKDTPKTDAQAEQQAEQPQPTPSQTGSSSSDGLEPDEATGVVTDETPADVQANRREQMTEEEAAILPYYNNYLSTYHLGPEDVISVTVFGQDRYSKTGIVVPPNGRISYPLVGNVFVAGRTTDQVEADLTKRLDEYIIDPKVTVALEKAMSARYSVLGDVGTPGIRIMTRRVSVLEALADAGGVLPTGDKKKVVILRHQANGNVQPISINIKEIETGKAKEMAYLVPGDQIFVPGNRLKTIQKVMSFLPVLNFARIFGLPF